MENQIVKIDAKEFGIEESKAAQIAAQFKPMLDKMVELEAEYNKVSVLPLEDPETAKKAKELRLKYVKVRTGTAEIHREQKAFYLQAGRFIDGWKNAQLFASQGIEEKLEYIEKYLEIQEQNRILKLQAERLELLSKYEGFYPSGLTYGAMDEQSFNSLLNGAKLSYEAKIKADKEAEESRIEAEILEAERKAKEAEEERLRIEAQRIENERLKKEAEEKEKELAAERAKAEAERKALEEKARKEIEEAEKAAAVERAKQQAALKAQREAEAKLKAIEDAKKAEELRLKKEAEKLAKSSDKVKLKVWVDSAILLHPKTEGMSEESLILISNIQAKFEGFKKWANEQVNSL